MENDRLQRMQELVDKLNAYARAYYVEDAPLISDGEYDALEAQLIALEKETGIVLPDSPTHRVGGEPLAKFEEHRHLGRLWSLDKVRTVNGIREWISQSLPEQRSMQRQTERSLSPDRAAHTETLLRSATAAGFARCTDTTAECWCGAVRR